MVSYYLVVLDQVHPFTRTPLPDTTASASSTITATAMRTSTFTILSSVVFVVTLAHAQPNLRQRQSANSTIQWNPCAEAPAPAECALFTYVFYTLPPQITTPTPSLYQQRSTRLCKSRRWNHPNRNDTLPSTDTPTQGFHLREPRFASSRPLLCSRLL